MIVLSQIQKIYVTVQFLLCFMLYLRALFKYKHPRAYIRRGDLTVGFLCYEFEGLTFGGAYTWRGLFSEFYGSSNLIKYPYLRTTKLCNDMY